MASETDSNARIVKQPSGAAAVPALTLEQIKAEERDLEAYRQRRQAAKKKREAQKQKEMQRIVDEKQSMEEELEELRLMVAQGQNSNASAAAAASAESEALLTKKITKIRKKYEKKLNAAKEELEDLREVRESSSIAFAFFFSVSFVSYCFVLLNTHSYSRRTSTINASS